MANRLLPLALLPALATPLSAGEKVWSQVSDGVSIIPSALFDVPYTYDVEAADDFVLAGTVERILVSGYNVFGCSDDLAGVWVRFYASTGGVPGALLYEELVLEGSPLLKHLPCPFGLDIVLPRPFDAAGEHFVSVQLAGRSATSWSWWTANSSHPVGAPMHWRNNLAGGVWSTTVGGQPKNADLAFELYGVGPPPPPPTEELWAQYKTFLGDQLPAGVWPGPSAGDFEAADDFELTGSIERVQIGGEICFGCKSPTGVTGAWVRFYDAAGDMPGALAYEAFVPWGSAEFQCSCWQSIDLFLTTPFPAQGHHFVSVQVAASQPHDFGWSEANEGEPVLATLKVRDRLAGGPWQTSTVAPSSDLAFSLFGKDLAPPPTLVPDPCGTWEEVPTPLLGAASPQVLRGVAVVAPDDVWAVGSADQGPRALHWDGVGWESVPVPAPSVSPSHVPSLDDVEPAGPDDVWAAGSQWLLDAGGFPKPHVFVLHWDGSAWTEVAPTQPHVLGGVYGIEVVAPDDVWFVGWTGQTFGPGCNQALTMHWDGASLTAIETPCPDLGCEVGALGGYALESASAIAADDIWGVGGGTGPYHGICTYVVHYDGTSWNHVPTPEPGLQRRLYDVHALATDDVWAVGTYLDGLGYHSYVIHWDGGQWTYEDLPGGGAALHAFAPDDIYAVGDRVVHYDGTAWSWVDDLGALGGGVVAPSLLDLDAPGPCGLWAVGRQADFSVGLVPFAVRQDAGQYWSATLREPCTVPAPPDSLALAQPPQLGGTFAVGIDDPTASAGFLPGTTLTVWALALQPAPGFPCGTPLRRWGELLIDVLGQPLLFTAPQSWAGPGTPSVHAVLVPDEPALVGVGLATQGALLDLTGPARFTRALDAVLGF